MKEQHYFKGKLKRTYSRWFYMVTISLLWVLLLLEVALQICDCRLEVVFRTLSDTSSYIHVAEGHVHEHTAVVRRSYSSMQHELETREELTTLFDTLMSVPAACYVMERLLKACKKNRCRIRSLDITRYIERMDGKKRERLLLV